MGHVKEPAGVNFIVDSTPLKAEDRKKISKIIAHYKATGEKLLLRKSTRVPRALKVSKTVKQGRNYLVKQR